MQPQLTHVLHTGAFAWTGLGSEGLAPARRIGFCADWTLAGPIIERESITIIKNGPYCTACTAFASKVRTGLEPDLVGNGLPWPGWTGDFLQHGATPLQAAMRAYVASKFGDSVDTP